MFWRHPLLSIVTLLYLGFVWWLTLTPAPIGSWTNTLVLRIIAKLNTFAPLAWLDLTSTERIANILLFIPVGILFLLIFGRSFWWLAIIAGAGMSVFIEWFQGQFLPTRVSDSMDITMNSTGTIVGVLLALLLTMSTEHYYAKSQRQEQQLREQAAEIEALRAQSRAARGRAPASSATSAPRQTAPQTPVAPRSPSDTDELPWLHG